MNSDLIRHFSGSWQPTQGYVRLRLETDEQRESREIAIMPDQIEPLVTLLLMLGVKTDAAPHGVVPQSGDRAIPLPVDSLEVGETEDGDALIQMTVGPATLAFQLPHSAVRQLGQSLLALSVSSAQPHS